MKRLLFSRHAVSSVCLVCSMAMPLPSRGQNYLGAETVLKHVEELNAKPAAARDTNSLAALRDDLKKFRDNVTNLPPDQAAKGWLELVDRVAKTHRSIASPMSMPIQANDLFEALPPPADWPELSRSIAARPKNTELPGIGLRFLAAILNNNVEAKNQAITNLQALAQGADIQSMYQYQSLLQELNRATLELSNDPDAILSSLENQMAAARSDQGGFAQISVPNLVVQVGAEKAEAFLRKALVRRGVTLNFETPNETSRLAQKIALELIDQLKVPQWGLVNSLDAVELYKALDKHFPVETNQTPSPAGVSGVPIEPMGFSPRDQAQVYYFLGLISQGQPKDAIPALEKLGPKMSALMSSDAFNQMERAGYTVALDNFFYEFLSHDPTLPLWDEYVQLAAKAGTTDRMLALARSAVARQDFSDKKKAVIDNVLYKALLAADQTDEAVQELRRLMTMEQPTQPYTDHDNGQLGIELARLGLLLNKPEWTQAGIAAAKKFILGGGGDNPAFAWTSGPVLAAIEDILFKANQGPAAESILMDVLPVMAKMDNTRPAYEMAGFASSCQVLIPLAALYHQAGRQQDVLTLFEQSPYWGVGDLAQLANSSLNAYEISMGNLHAESSTPLSYFAADALLAAGRRPEAQKITGYLLDQHPGLDRGYELLLALEGTNAIPRLDELFARDQFEERPLIWKAHLLRQQNKLAEAEAVARHAISIDPSDGEEGRGDRMRAYAELADIRDAQGEKKDAEFYREVVKSIRMSEDADQFYRVGLLKHAIPMYEEALNHFADAYCIQSRLAVQLSELGKNKEAEEHYRRAYELMPDSFGRVESHCFGCEKVFNGDRAQGIADRVFTKLVDTRPDKPQVHYLLGYLREEQELYADALTNYQAATRLDPSYLNAWIKLDGISSHVLLAPKERDQIIFNILRLDPLRRHSHIEFRQVSDLSGLWDAVAAANQRQPAVQTNLFTLIASKAALDKKPRPADASAVDEEMFSSMRQNERSSVSPGVAVGQNAFVALAGQMIVGQGSMFY